MLNGHPHSKLMLSAVKLDKIYHELIEMIVFSHENKVCMIHRCEKCLGIHQLENYLEKKVMNSFDDKFAGFKDIKATKGEEKEIITFKQWVSTNRADLITQIHSMHPLSARGRGGRGLNLLPNFQKREGLTGPQLWEGGGCWKRGE